MSTLTATGALPKARPDAPDAVARRRRRATVARKLLSAAPEAAAGLEWDALDTAPAWLALPDTELMVLARQVGAVVCASNMRLWIDGARLAAARAALGAPFMQALLALPEAELLPRNVAPCPMIDGAEQVAAQLRSTGLAVLLASLASGSLRRAAGAALGTQASSMAQVLAHSLVARAQKLGAPRAPRASAAKSPAGVNA